MVLWHVVQNNRWQQDIYVAITVPDDAISMFYPYLEMQGMVFKLTPNESDDGRPVINSDKMWQNFNEVYDFTSVVDEDGFADHSIYRDAQTAHLLRNYPASLGRIGWDSAQAGDFDRAREALEWAYRLDPSVPLVASALPIVYMQDGDHEAALDAGRRTLPYQQHPSTPALELGENLLTLQEYQLAVDWAAELVRAAPDEPEYTQQQVRALLLNDQVSEARAVVEDWVARTGDTSARQSLERMLLQLDTMKTEASLEETP